MKLCHEGYANAENVYGDYRCVPMPREVEGRPYPSLAYASAWALQPNFAANKRIQQEPRQEQPLFCLFSHSQIIKGAR